jgi:hypothetical protein
VVGWCQGFRGCRWAVGSNFGSTVGIDGEVGERRSTVQREGFSSEEENWGVVNV